MESDKSKRQTDSIKHQSLFFSCIAAPLPPEKVTNTKSDKNTLTPLWEKLRAVTRPSLNHNFRFSDKLCWHTRSWCHTGLCGNWNRFFFYTVSNLLNSHINCSPVFKMFLPGCLQNSALITDGNYFPPHVGRTRRQISTPPGTFTL